jgi:preprotein translocase subunit SecF
MFTLIPPHTKYDFIGKWKPFAILSAAVFFLGVFGFVYGIIRHGSGFNYSVEFRGGTELNVDFSRPVDIDKVRRALEPISKGTPDVVKVGGEGASENRYLVRLRSVSSFNEKQAADMQRRLEDTFGKAKDGKLVLRRFKLTEGGDRVEVRFREDVDQDKITQAFESAGVKPKGIERIGRKEDHEFEVVLIELDSAIRQALDKGLGAGAVKTIPKIESVGAKAGEQLRVEAAKSLGFTILLLLIYIGWRFEFTFAPGAIIALIHDVIIVAGIFAFMRWEFSMSVLAALLTILGYSINDTIVVYDRIRENLSKHRDRKLEVTINEAINDTLSRTILTSGATMLSMVVLYFFGSEVTKDFSVAMILGIIFGTYSSIFIASPISILLQKYYTAKPERPRPRSVHGEV